MKLVIVNVGDNYNNSYRTGCAGLFNNIFYKTVKEEKYMYGVSLC